MTKSCKVQIYIFLAIVCKVLIAIEFYSTKLLKYESKIFKNKYARGEIDYDQCVLCNLRKNQTESSDENKENGNCIYEKYLYFQFSKIR